MIWRKIWQLKIAPDSNYITRVLLYSFPSALVFALLVSLSLLTPYWALLSYVWVVIFNMIILLPSCFELQLVKNYIRRLAKGEAGQHKINLSDNEASQIAEAVNSMHKFWAYRIDELEAQTMSDAAVLDTLPDPVMMIDHVGDIIGANLAARNLLGENLTKSNVEKVFEYHPFINALNRILNKETEAENLFFYLHNNLEQKMYAHIKSLPWFSKGRAVAVIALYDLSKSLSVEKMQSDFVANASHELRTPLSVISGFIETLQTTAKDDENARADFLKIMADQAEYMSSLIENLLSLSRIEMQLHERPSVPTDVERIMSEAIEALEVKAKERQVKIKLKALKNLPQIPADAAQIRQVFQNLLENALKYGISPGTINVQIGLAESIPPSKTFSVAQGKALVVSVNNKGPRIKPEDLSRLTERFYRIQEHKDLNIKGTGLGLSIAKQVIRRHQGNLTVSSTNSNGTTFTVYLPIQLS